MRRAAISTHEKKCLAAA